jgi:uncharacterized protein (DUF697 family)
MAAPTPTTRVAPASSANKLKQGHGSRLTLAVDPDILFWEKEITPPGMTSGVYEIGDMYNTAWQQKVVNALKTMTAVTLVVNYAPETLPLVAAVIGVMTTATVTFPSGATWAFYAVATEFKPNALKKDDQPNANMTIEPTNTDPSDGSEAGPVYTAAP